MKQTDRPVLLDPQAAISCPVKTLNHFDRTISVPKTYATRDSSESSAIAREDRLSNQSLIDQAITRLAGLPGALDLRRLECEDPYALISVTQAAIAQGVPLIISPKLPVDRNGHRRGSPDLLVRGADHSADIPGYVPVLVRPGRCLEGHSRAHQVACSPLITPSPDEALDLTNARLRSRRTDDQLKLAHFWRMLEAAGWESAREPIGGILGTDLVRRTMFSATDDQPEPALALHRTNSGSRTLAIAWAPLAQKRIRTFARTAESGWKLRSALERYDHEHSFRVNVAQTSLDRSRGITASGPQVAPIVVPQCASCQWWDVCAPKMGTDDLSVRIDKSPLDVREVSALRSLGIQTIHDLAQADLDALLVHYLPLVQHRDRTDQRLLLAAHRARMLSQGTELERTTRNPIQVPCSPVEMDWDIETSADDRIYLWGFWISDSADWRKGAYRWFGRFCDLDAASETELAIEALTWLVTMLEENPGTRVYHYSDYEMVHVERLAKASKNPIFERAKKLLISAHSDLFTLIQENFFGAHGLGLKKVATTGAGFHWRDPEPGGLNSQTWFSQACHDCDPDLRMSAQNRILAYNEDDVRATAALRDWLRAEHSDQNLHPDRRLAHTLS